MGDTFDDVLAGFTAQRATARITMRGDLAVELERLGEQLDEAKRFDEEANDAATATALPIAERIAELEAEADASVREFVFECIGARQWSDLVAAHPPSAEQKDEGAQWGETFGEAAMQRSCVQPKMTEAQCRTLRSRLSVGQWGKLFAAMVQANVGDETGPKSQLASQLLRASNPKPTTASRKGSPARLSSAAS